MKRKQFSWNDVTGRPEKGGKGTSGGWDLIDVIFSRSNEKRKKPKCVIQHSSEERVKNKTDCEEHGGQKKEGKKQNKN